jgi:hypothetical protein
MPKLHAEALVFALAWVALAVTAAMRGGWIAGAVMTAGLLLLIMPASSIVLSKTGNFSLERQVRWGILVVAALGFGLIQMFWR